MALRDLDVVVLTEDVPSHGLKLGVEFVTASGRTQALVTLPPSAMREVGDDDLVVAVRPTTSREV